MVNVGRKRTGLCRSEELQYPFKGNLLSAQLRTHRNSCKSRIDTGQLSKEGESNGFVIQGVPKPGGAISGERVKNNYGRFNNEKLILDLDN